MQPPERTVFVLDQNFLRQVVGLPWPADVLLVPLEQVNAGLIAETEDWEVILELEYRGSFSGFITNDANILRSSREMLALSMSRLSLIATDGVGHDPMKASGLVMVHLSDIVRDSPGQGMTYRLRPGGKTALSPGKCITQIAEHRSAARANVVANDRAAILQRVTEMRPHLLPLLAARAGNPSA